MSVLMMEKKKNVALCHQFTKLEGEIYILIRYTFYTFEFIINISTMAYGSTRKLENTVNIRACLI